MRRFKSLPPAQRLLAAFSPSNYLRVRRHLPAVEHRVVRHRWYEEYRELAGATAHT